MLNLNLGTRVLILTTIRFFCFLNNCNIFHILLENLNLLPFQDIHILLLLLLVRNSFRLYLDYMLILFLFAFLRWKCKDLIINQPYGWSSIITGSAYANT